MKKIILVIIFNLIFISLLKAQDVVVVAPPINFNGVETNIIKNVIEQNKKQLKLANNYVKVFYTKEENKYVIARLSRFTYKASYVLVTIDGNTINIVDNDYIPKDRDFELYEQKTELNKAASNDVDFLFATSIDADTAYEAIDAITNCTDYATNLGYNVEELIESDATASAFKNCITNNNLIAVGIIDHGTCQYITINGEDISHTWFASQDLRGEIYFFNSCDVYLDPFKSAMLNSGGARTFIGGKRSLPHHTSEHVFQNFWDYTLNDECRMNTALSQAADTLINLYGIGGDIGILKLTTSGTLSRDEVWIKEVDVTGNLYVPTGKSLALKTGSTVNLNGYSIISTGGTITVDDDATISGLKAEIKNMYTLAVKGLYSSIETALNSSLAPGNKVEIQSGTFSGISIYGKDDLTIRGTASTYFTGTLDFYYCDNLDLASLECESLNMAYCDDAILSINIYGSSSQIGIHLTSCSNYYATGNVSNCNFGAGTYASSGWFSTDYYENNNTSFYSIASSDLGVHQVKLCESINYDYQAVSNGHISAYGCYVKDGTSRTYTSEGGTIDIGSSLDCSSLMGKENDLSLMQIQSDDPVETEFSKINASYFDLLKTINEEDDQDEESGKRELYSQLLTIVENFKTFITNNPKSSLSHVALNTAANSFSLFEDYDGMKSFLDEIINNKDLTTLKGEAENLMTEYYGKVKDFDRAISTADAVIKTYESDDEILCDALFRKGMMLAYQMEQPKEAIEYFATIVNNYKENPLYETAVYQLETLGEAIIEEPEEDQAEGNSGIETSVYPNPFNPTTTINYTLPEEGKVNIKIYDVLGREVETLVNEIRTAGTHSVEFNASHLPSGVYLYKIETSQGMLTKKMLLLK